MGVLRFRPPRFERATPRKRHRLVAPGNHAGASKAMAVSVDTKDCTALTDGELEEMGDICAGGPARFDIGLLSKARDEWVLTGHARVEGKLQGFSFSTLERIGGTPCVLIGMMSVKRTAQRNSVLKALMHEHFHRALMAFPDEDVVVGAKLATPSGFDAFKLLDEIIPRPGHRAVGEERAWGRRLVKRFSVEGAYDDSNFTVKGTGGVVGVIDFESLKPETIKPEVVDLFKGLKPSKGDCLIAHGWAMAEDLAKYTKSPG